MGWRERLEGYSSPLPPVAVPPVEAGRRSWRDRMRAMEFQSAKHLKEVKGSLAAVPSLHILQGFRRYESSETRRRNTECTDFEERAALIAEGSGVPQAWAEAYAGLCGAVGVESGPLLRQAVDNAGYFLDEWGAQAAALGWRPEWVFGNTPPMAGLAFCVLGGRVLAIGQSTVKLRMTNGVISTCRLTRKSVQVFGCYWETHES